MITMLDCTDSSLRRGDKISQGSGCVQWGSTYCQERLSVWTHFLTTVPDFFGYTHNSHSLQKQQFTLVKPTLLMTTFLLRNTCAVTYLPVSSFVILPNSTIC